jgi:HK97 family phage prohead protease
MWIRTAQLVDVSFQERTIELIVVPYDTPALVPYQGRMVHESICRGAFDGIERRANRVRVNREHERMQTVGRAVAFHPSRDEGLVSEIKIAKTPLGDDTLELAADGCLDASAGFLPMNGGMRWLGRTAYEVTKGWLGHIAMTSEPAYEGAQVLAVRSAGDSVTPSKTPNLDQVREWRLADRVASDPALK